MKTKSNLATPAQCGITPVQFRNLCILTVGVHSLHITGRRKKPCAIDWYMGNFLHMDGIPADGFDDEARKPSPGTKHCSMCLCGHGPVAGVPVAGRETWKTYTLRAFGLKMFEPRWEWLFGSDHTNGEMGPRDAVTRLGFFLTRGDELLQGNGLAHFWSTLDDAECHNLRAGEVPFSYDDIPWSKIKAAIRG